MVIRPYNDNTLNIFDGIVLHIMVFVVVVPVFDTMNSNVIFAVVFTLVILPLFIFLMGFIVHKVTMKRFIIKNCTCNAKNSEVEVDDGNQGGIDVIIVDERMRQNATVCDV